MEQEGSGVKIDEKKRSQKCWQFLRSLEITLKVGSASATFLGHCFHQAYCQALSLNVKENMSSKTQINWLD